MAITAIYATTPRKTNPIVIKSASQVATPLRISQLVTGRTLIPMTPANRNELNMVALIFIAKMMMATPAPATITLRIEDFSVLETTFKNS